VSGKLVTFTYHAWKTEEIPHRLALIIIFFTGVILRISFLFQPIMLDESVTYMNYAALPLSHVLSFYPEPNNHILHTFFVHFTTRLFGSAVWVIRTPAFLAGILIIPVTYIVIRKLFNKNAAVITTALVAVSSPLIAYSANGRGFTIQVLIFLLLIIVAIQVKQTGNLVGWVLFIVLSALGFYTIPTMLYFFGTVALWLFFSAIYKDTPIPRSVFIIKLIVASILTGIITTLLYLPVFFNSGWGLAVSNRWVESIGWSSFISGFPRNMLDVWKFWTQDIPLVLSLILTLGFIASIFFYKHISKHRINMAVVAICWCVPLLFIMKVLPPGRVWLPLLPLFLGYASAGLCYFGTKLIIYLKEKETKLPKIKPATALVILVAFTMFLGILVHANQSPYQPADQVTLRDAEYIALYLKDNLKQGDIIYCETNIRRPLQYYLSKYDVSLDYLFMSPENVDRKYKGIDRAFVIAAEKEGYPLETSIGHSNLKDGVEKYLYPVVEFPYSLVYVIYNPVLRESSIEPPSWWDKIEEKRGKENTEEK